MRYALISLLLIAGIAHAQHESEYTRKWCSEHGGEQEYTTYHGTRVDCLTDEYAVEVDRARNFYNAIGQAEYYAAVTARKPGIVIIVGPGDAVYMRRLRMTNRVRGLGIQIWTVPE